MTGAPGCGRELLADVEAVVGTAVDDQHDLESTRDIEGAQGGDQFADGRGAVVDRDDDREHRRLTHRASPRSEESRRTASERPVAITARSIASAAENSASSQRG